MRSSSITSALADRCRLPYVDDVADDGDEQFALPPIIDRQSWTSFLGYLAHTYLSPEVPQSSGRLELGEVVSWLFYVATGQVSDSPEDMSLVVSRQAEAELRHVVDHYRQCGIDDLRAEHARLVAERSLETGAITTGEE